MSQRNRRNLKAKDKAVRKMTKDGLIEKNITAGENKRISNRDESFDLRSEIVETDLDISTHKLAKQATSQTLSPDGDKVE